jgi:predicted lipoprotein
MFRTMLIAVLVLAGAPTAAADYDAGAYRRVNEGLVAAHVVPRYARFAEAAAMLDREAGKTCGAVSPAAVAGLRDAALAAQDAWQAVQHIRFGPIEQDMRATRLAFWPDLRNRTGRELAALLKAHDASILAPDAFVRANVVVQGFPALERLLFDPDAERLLTGGSEDARYRCALVRAIAGNIAAIAAAVHKEWIEGADPYTAIVAKAGGEFARYRTSQEATLDLFKSLHAAVELAADHKLAPPLGESLEAARPKLGESWRSGRSLDNIRRNLEAAQAMYLGEAGNGFSKFVRETTKDAALDDLLRRAFAQTTATAASVAMPLAKAVADPKERAKLETLKTEAVALKTILAQRLTAALAIPLGFNALDGD